MFSLEIVIKSSFCFEKLSLIQGETDLEIIYMFTLRNFLVVLACRRPALDWLEQYLEQWTASAVHCSQQQKQQQSLLTLATSKNLRNARN